MAAASSVSMNLRQVHVPKKQRRKRKRLPSNLTEVEKAKLRKQNNRRAAQDLRDRHREYEQSLEQQVGTLENEGSELNQQLTKLQHDNDTLKEEIARLRNALSATQAVDTPMTTELDMSPLSTLSPQITEVDLPMQQDSNLDFLPSSPSSTTSATSASTTQTTSSTQDLDLDIVDLDLVDLSTVMDIDSILVDDEQPAMSAMDALSSLFKGDDSSPAVAGSETSLESAELLCQPQQSESQAWMTSPPLAPLPTSRLTATPASAFFMAVLLNVAASTVKMQSMIADSRSKSNSPSTLSEPCRISAGAPTSLRSSWTDAPSLLDVKPFPSHQTAPISCCA